MSGCAIPPARLKQSRAMAFAEAGANVAVGYGVAVLTQILVFPLFGLHASLAENMGLGAVFTGVSIVRSYALRRLFETIKVRRLPRPQLHGPVQ